MNKGNMFLVLGLLCSMQVSSMDNKEVLVNEKNNGKELLEAACNQAKTFIKEQAIPACKTGYQYTKPKLKYVGRKIFSFGVWASNLTKGACLYLEEKLGDEPQNNQQAAPLALNNVKERQEDHDNEILQQLLNEVQEAIQEDGSHEAQDINIHQNDNVDEKNIDEEQAVNQRAIEAIDVVQNDNIKELENIDVQQDCNNSQNNDEQKEDESKSENNISNCIDDEQEESLKIIKEQEIAAACKIQNTWRAYKLQNK